MYKVLLAATTVLTLAGLPAYAQSTPCPQGASNDQMATCENDDDDDGGAAATPDPGNALNASQAGQGVTDTVNSANDGGNNNGGGGNNGGGNNNGGGGNNN